MTSSYYPIISSAHHTQKAWSNSYHGRHLLTRVCSPQQESSTPLQERRKVIHIHPTQVIQKDFDNMEYDMLWDNLELGEDGKVPNVLGA
jgi:hypothetical protein